MAKPFDATLNDLIDLRPGDWADTFGRLAGIPPGPSTVLDTDLATTLQADKLFRIDGPLPSLLHLELEANPRTGIPRELMRYNTLIDHQHGLPVETVLILLRPKAFASDQTGVYRREGVRNNKIAEFRYHVEKVWERSVDYWFQRGSALAPLAMLTDEADHRLEDALDGYRSLIRSENLEGGLTERLLGSSYVLCGLRYDKTRIQNLFRRFDMLMEESTTYQAILEEGREKGLTQGLNQGLTQGRQQSLRDTLLRLGTKKLGRASLAIHDEIHAIRDADHLEQLIDRIFEAGSWDELLAVG